MGTIETKHKVDKDINPANLENIAVFLPHFLGLEKMLKYLNMTENNLGTNTIYVSQLYYDMLIPFTIKLSTKLRNIKVTKKGVAKTRIGAPGWLRRWSIQLWIFGSRVRAPRWV